MDIKTLKKRLNIEYKSLPNRVKTIVRIIPVIKTYYIIVFALMKENFIYIQNILFLRDTRTY
jgi:hypothetical protein